MLFGVVPEVPVEQAEEGCRVTVWMSPEQRHIAAWVIACPGVSLSELARNVGAANRHRYYLPWFRARVTRMEERQLVTVRRDYGHPRAPGRVYPTAALLKWHRDQWQSTGVPKGSPVVDEEVAA